MTNRRLQDLVRGTLIVVGVLHALFVIWVIVTSLDLTPWADTAPDRRLGRLSVLIQRGLGGSFGVLGAFLAARAGRKAGVLVLAGYLVAQGFATGYLLNLGFLGVTGWPFFIARALVNWMAYSLAIRLTQLFPRELSVGDRPAMGHTRMSRVLGAVVFSVRGPLRTWAFTFSLLALSLLIPREIIFQLGQLTVIALVVATMTMNYRASDAEDRRKIYWLLLGAAFLLLGRILIAVAQISIAWSGLSSAGGLGVLRPLIWTIANFGLMASLLVAVFYTGAIDPRLALRRTAAYSLGAGVLLFMFAAFENFFSEAVAEFLGLGSGLVQAFAGAAVALLFKPLSDLLSNLTERALPKTEPPRDPVAEG